jgi:hypothetical protein
MEPTLRLIKNLQQLFQIELSIFRIMGWEINQTSLNSLLALFFTLSVATLSNIVIDLGLK